MGLPLLSIGRGGVARPARHVAGVIEPDEVTHLVRERVLQILIGADERWIGDEIAPGEVLRVDLDVAVLDLPRRLVDEDRRDGERLGRVAAGSRHAGRAAPARGAEDEDVRVVEARRRRGAVLLRDVDPEECADRVGGADLGRAPGRRRGRRRMNDLIRRHLHVAVRVREAVGIRRDGHAGLRPEEPDAARRLVADEGEGRADGAQASERATSATGTATRGPVATPRRSAGRRALICRST